MFDYTKAAFGKIFDDAKKLGVIFTIASQLFMIAYLTYAVITNESLRIVNGILLALAVCYFFFYLQITKGDFTKKEKSIKKRIDVSYKIVRRLAKLYTLGVSVFGLYTALKTADFISVFLTIFTVVAFLLQIAIDVLVFVVERYKNLVVAGLEADAKPLIAINNFKKKLFGQEVEEEKDPPKELAILEPLVKKAREEKEQQKTAKKQARKEKRAEKLLDKQRLKAEKAAEKEREKQRKKEAAANVAATQDVLSESAISKDEKPKKRK